MTAPTLDDATWLAAVRDAAAALASTDPTDLGAPVTACPGWSVADLLGHVGQIHRWCGALLAAPAGERVPYGEAPVPGRADELGAWVLAGAEEVTAALAADDRDRTVGSWAGRQPVAWWTRRLAHETTLHAWDAGHATGHPTTLAPALAVDGIDELFDVFVPRRFPVDGFGGAGESLHLHATDTEGEWLVRFEPEAVVVTREHAKGDVAARGRAEDLLLFLWGRADASALEVFGDASLLDRWQAAARF